MRDLFQDVRHSEQIGFEKLNIRIQPVSCPGVRGLISTVHYIYMQ